jgi:predicted metal-dependent phosphotriesterase family hydrolase
MATASEQLAEAQKQQADLAAKVEALLKQTRDEDLKTAKQLIERHGFLQKDLIPELKTRGVAAKKAAVKKSPARKKAK